MNDRKQLDDFGAFRQSLLRSAEIDEPAMPNAVRRQIMARAATAVGVGVGVGAVAGQSSAMVVGKSATMVLVAKWFGVGAVAAAAGVGTLRVADTIADGHPRGQAVVQPVRSSARVATGTTVRAPEGSARGVDDDSTTARPTQQGPVPVEPAISSGPRAERTVRASVLQSAAEISDDHAPAVPGPREPVESLAPELALLDQARGALASNDARAALAFLSAYGERFPRGSLKPEAMALRIKALDHQGDHAAARQLAQRFLVEYPASPHTQQIRALAGSRDLSR